MASNCCYRLESQKKSWLAGFLSQLQHSLFLEKNLFYLLIHICRYMN